MSPRCSSGCRTTRRRWRLSGWTTKSAKRSSTLTEHGFIVPSRAADTEALNKFFTDYREDTEQMRVTVLTTLQCNFACDYCFQGDHGDYNKHADRMSLDDSARLSAWIEQRLDELKPKRLTITFFGGEPLLNIPVVYDQAERAFAACQKRGVTLALGIITNGLLLTEELVDRLLPLRSWLREGHARRRPRHAQQDASAPRRPGHVRQDHRERPQGRRQGADCDRRQLRRRFGRRAIPPCSTFSRSRTSPTSSRRSRSSRSCARRQVPKNVIPLTVVSGQAAQRHVHDGGRLGRVEHLRHLPVRGRAAVHLREETKKRGFPTVDGVHMGPCEIHKRHAYTIGPNGSTYACPGFTGEPTLSTGHIDDRKESWRMSAAERFEHLAAWHKCGDCAFIPGLRGRLFGRLAHGAWRHEHADVSQAGFESALISLAHEAASAS